MSVFSFLSRLHAAPGSRAAGYNRMFHVCMLALLSCFGPMLSDASALVLVQQPGASAALVGSPAGFGVVAAGSGAISYQWRKNGTNIAGATSATYTISAAALADTGIYTVVVRDSTASVTSAAAELGRAEPSELCHRQPAHQGRCFHRGAQPDL